MRFSCSCFCIFLNSLPYRCRVKEKDISRSAVKDTLIASFSLFILSCFLYLSFSHAPSFSYNSEEEEEESLRKSVCVAARNCEKREGKKKQVLMIFANSLICVNFSFQKWNNDNKSWWSAPESMIVRINNCRNEYRNCSVFFCFDSSWELRNATKTDRGNRGD